MVSNPDNHYMNAAISMARRGIGRTAENPSVGCVIVKDDVVIARSHTSDGGRPHAETLALSQVGDKAQGATLYVTLEPCTHHGQTPPCVEAIINAGIERVVIGTQDVDPRVSGTAQNILENAGICVTQNICKDECDEVINGFRMRMTQNRPFITLKMACSLDGKTALSNGKSKWITGDLARRHVHKIRSQHDAILVGVGTAMSDDPMLTTRIDGVSHKAARVVLDSDMRLDPRSNLVASAKDIPLLMFYTKESKGFDALKQAGVIMHPVKKHDLREVLNLIAGHGISRLLVEGGRGIHTSFLRDSLCDELLLYRASDVLGGDSMNAFGDMGIADLNDRYHFSKISTLQLGQDVLETLRPITKHKG